MSVSKSKHAGLRGPIKQENNIKYRTYCRNKYNRDKTKKEIFTDLILGAEVSKKDTIRQDNSNNVITFQQTNNNHQNNESDQIGDRLAKVFISINRQTSSTETIIIERIFSEQPIAIEAGNNDHKHKDNKINKKQKKKKKLQKL